MKSASHSSMFNKATIRKNLLAITIGIFCFTGISSAAFADAHVLEKIKEGKPIASVRVRYEEVAVDESANEDAQALTAKAVVGYESADIHGVSFLVEYESVVALQDDYAPEKAGYEVVADPESNEFNRASVSYKNDLIHATLGRQRIILDNARFIGNVGWRQNEQTYDAASVSLSSDNAKVFYAYINQVHDILGNDTDVTNHLVNVNFSSDQVLSITGFAYLLETDDTEVQNNTYGALVKGTVPSEDLAFNYQASYAAQTNENPNGADSDATYLQLEGGIKISGIAVALGQEILGSDDGTYGFQTPLATKHAYQGWADKFLVTPDSGISDAYLKVVTHASGIRLLAMYHDYETVEGSGDLGSEINLLASGKINKHFSVGLKYASYRAGDSGSDTDKLWLWGQAKF